MGSVEAEKRWINNKLTVNYLVFANQTIFLHFVFVDKGSYLSKLYT